MSNYDKLIGDFEYYSPDLSPTDYPVMYSPPRARTPTSIVSSPPLVRPSLALEGTPPLSTLTWRHDPPIQIMPFYHHPLMTVPSSNQLKNTLFPLDQYPPLDVSLVPIPDTHPTSPE